MATFSSNHDTKHNAAAGRSSSNSRDRDSFSAWERRPAPAAALSLSGESSEESSDEGESFWRQLTSQLNLERRRISKRQLYWVSRQLALMLETGVDLAEALALVASQSEHPALRDCLEEIEEAIHRGVGLSAAIQEQEDVLGPEVCATLRAGEASGRLAETFRQLADRLKDEVQLRGTIRSALAYPLTLGIVAQLVMLVLIWFVLPQFAETFSSMSIEPPWITRVLIEGAKFIRSNVLLVGISLVGLVVSGVVLSHRPEFMTLCNKICFSSPLLGTAIRNLAIGQVFVMSGQLLRSGIPLIETIRLVRNGTKFPEIHSMMDRWEAEVLEGKGLHGCMHEFEFLPEGAASMLLTAEKTGRLDSILIQAGEHYREEGTNRLKDLLKLSEPAIILGLGVMVGVVVASVLLPMLDIQSAKI